MRRPVPAEINAPFEREHETEAGRHCHAPGCPEQGVHRAPVARDRLDQYYWFCRDHVRQYNLAWNYFAGMNEQEIEFHRRFECSTSDLSSFPGPSKRRNNQPLRPFAAEQCAMLPGVTATGVDSRRLAGGRRRTRGGRPALIRSVRPKVILLDVELPDGLGVDERYGEWVLKQHDPRLARWFEPDDGELDARHAEDAR